MNDFAAVIVTLLRGEVYVLGQMVVPGLLEGQVSLIGPRDLGPVLEQLQAQLGGVEAADVTDQDVGLVILPWGTRVDLHFGRSVFGQRGAREHQEPQNDTHHGQVHHRGPEGPRLDRRVCCCR